MQHQPRILLIEPEPNLRHTPALILGQSGYAVTTACQDALRGAEVQAYDLVFLDVDRVEPGNSDLGHTLHQLAPDVPVLILAASPAIGQINAASAVRHRAYLVKPIDPAKMLACIRDLLARSLPSAN